MTALARRLRSADWIWAALGALVMWVLLGLFAGRFNLESLLATSTTTGITPSSRSRATWVSTEAT